MIFRYEHRNRFLIQKKRALSIKRFFVRLSCRLSDKFWPMRLGLEWSCRLSDYQLTKLNCTCKFLRSDRLAALTCNYFAKLTLEFDVYAMYLPDNQQISSLKEHLLLLDKLAQCIPKASSGLWLSIFKHEAGGDVGGRHDFSKISFRRLSWFWHCVDLTGVRPFFCILSMQGYF